jgi:para-nitrobenzyl esterase
MTTTNRPIVDTKSGKLQGTFENGLYIFRGIPFANPPVGDLRWAPPHPMKPWSGIRLAEKFGTICPQLIMPSVIPGRKSSEEPQNEDCLFLNIWTPGLDDHKRAVMVWIHGGAFTNGSGSSPTTPGETLANRGGIVMVTINYRLGALGFLNLKEVTGEKIPATGNEGFLDQVAALQWVRDNIAAFGGDPDNVTVFGESAGAESIGALLAMKEAKGLFQKAILQSGASKAQPIPQSVAAAGNFVGQLGLTGKDVDALLALPVDAIKKAQLKLAEAAASGVSGGNLGPVQDGKILKGVPLDTVAQGSAREVTVLAGSNLEEGKLFAKMGPDFHDLDEAGLQKRAERLLTKEYAATIVEKYRKALVKRDLAVTPFEIYVAIMGDQHFRMPNIRLCEIQEKFGKPAYGYVFTWKSVQPDLGACHALDVGFIFDTLNEEFEGSGASAEQLSTTMQDAWIAFAKTGDPSTPELAWPRYGKDRRMMVLGENSRVETAPYEAERAAWEGLGNEYLG